MRTSQNHTPTDGFTNLDPSLTVPDQSLTLRELLTNYTRGQELPTTNKQPAFFDSEAHIPNLKKLDLVELQELALSNAKKAETLNQNLKELQTKTVIHPPQKGGGTETDA